MEGCHTYKNEFSCQQCDYRYVLNKDSGLCEMNAQTTEDCCATRGADNSCLKCKSGLYMVNGKCQESNILGCLEKDSHGTCINCASGILYFTQASSSELVVVSWPLRIVWNSPTRRNRPVPTVPTDTLSTTTSVSWTLSWAARMRLIMSARNAMVPSSWRMEIARSKTARPTMTTSVLLVNAATSLPAKVSAKECKQAASGTKEDSVLIASPTSDSREMTVRSKGVLTWRTSSATDVTRTTSCSIMDVWWRIANLGKMDHVRLVWVASTWGEACASRTRTFRASDPDIVPY